MRLLVLLLIGALAQSAEPTSSADADIWSTVLYELRMGSFRDQRGPLVVVDRTMPSSDLNVPVSRELDLANRLRELNESAVPVAGIYLLPNTRMIRASTLPTPSRNEHLFGVMNWRKFQNDFPEGRLLRLSRPVFSADGSKAMVYYELSGRFDDGQGSYCVFAKKAGRWVIVDHVGKWIN